MLDDVRNYVRAGLEAVGSQGTDALPGALVARAQGLAEQLSSLASGFLEWSAEARASLLSELRVIIAGQIREMGVASEQEVRKLQERVEKLERAATGKAAGGARRSSTAASGPRSPASPPKSPTARPTSPSGRTKASTPVRTSRTRGASRRPATSRSAPTASE